MTIATTIFGHSVFGNKRIVWGKAVLSGSVATGDVITSLDYVESFQMNVAGGTQKGCSVNETLPLSSGSVTVVTESNDQTLYWKAMGR